MSACPRCSTPLTTHPTASGQLQGCLACGGIFVDRAMRARAVASLDRSVVEASNLAAAHARWSPDLASRIACPLCRAPMQVSRIGAGDFDLDVCDAHGAWFDRDELRRFLEALAAQRGGQVAAAAEAVAPASKKPKKQRSAPKKKDSDPPPSSKDGIGAGEVALGAVALLFELL